MKPISFILCLLMAALMGINTTKGQSTYFTTFTTGSSSRHTLGIKNDGKLWAWGYNGYGQLGDGTLIAKNVPTQVSTATNWVSVSAGQNHSMGITADGKLWTWGYNNQGQLGDGTNTAKNVPTQVGTATNWVSLSAGYFHSMGITADGKLWTWGYNGYGQLGDGTITAKNVPTQVGSATNWVNVSAGNSHSTGITADGMVWGWGMNSTGQLGDGTNTQSTIPKQSPVQATIASSLVGTSSTATMQQGQYNMYTSGGSFIASVNSRRASLTSIMGSVTAMVWVDATQPANYVKRHYQITPATNAGTVTGRPTLYFTQADFDAFNAVNSIKLPTGGSDATGIANLLIEKWSGISSDGSGLVNTYPTTTAPLTIDPADADIIWNASLNRWEVSFDVNGFSGFFVKTQSAVLPLHLTSFNGSKINGTNHLVWITTNEVNTKQFNIEWSLDAVQWNTLRTMAATGNSNNTYSCNHSNTPSGKIFYRLKMIDQDGQFTYSNIIWLGGSNKNNIVIYPNPVKNVVNIHTGNNLLNTLVSLTNGEGKLIKRILITNSQQTINMQNLPGGIYLLSFADGSQEKFIKE